MGEREREGAREREREREGGVRGIGRESSCKDRLKHVPTISRSKTL